MTAPTPPPTTGQDRPEAARRAWSRLRSALRPAARRGHLLPALLCALLGFAVVVQVRSTQDAGLDGLRQSDLVRILDDVTERSARLDAEVRDLEKTRARVTDATSGTRAALEEARARSLVLGILAGTLPAMGPGIELTISDPEGEVGPDVLVNTLQELRDAGAEAVEFSSLDGSAVRVVASTSFLDPELAGKGDEEAGADAVEGEGRPSRVLVDGTELRSPYRFRVIGDPPTLAAALDIPGGVLDVLGQQGAQGVVEQYDEVTITALRAAPSPRYARPAAGGANQ